MATTTVLLREDVDNLGARGETVKVKAGYARNYLLPRKLAVEATAGNVKQIEAERAALLRKEAKERGTAEAQAEQLRKVRLNIERKVGEHGHLYGSVTAMHVADALKEQGYEVDRRRILLADSIREVGEYSVPVRLHRDVTVEVQLTVAGEGGAASEGAANTAAASTSAASDAEAEEVSAGEATAEEAQEPGGGQAE